MADQGFGTTITFQTGLFGEVRNVNGSNLSRADLETTHMTSTNGYRTYIPADLKDPGELQIQILWDPATKAAAIKTAIGAAAETITVTFPIKSGQTNPATWVCSGFMTNFDFDDPYDAIMTGTATLKLTGEPTFTAGS